MKTNRLFEDVFMDIDWSLYDDEAADLTGLEKKIYSDARGYPTHRPKTNSELIAAIKEELKNGNTDLNCIDTSEITNMSWLFDQDDGSVRLSAEQQRTLDVSEWNVRNVRNMHSMFYNCKNFNQDLSGWDVSNVRDMWSMFCGCTKFNQDLSKWNVSNVKDMDWMFCRCTNFNQNISGWDVRNVESMIWMFDSCENFNKDLSGWDVRNVRNMNFMFNGCSNFNQDLSGWDVSNVRDMYGMFYGCTKLWENGLIPNWYKLKYEIE